MLIHTMGITGKFLLVCAIWCFLDQVHSIPSHKLKGSLPRQPLNAKAALENFNECGVSRKFEASVSKKFKVDHTLSVVGGENAILGDWPWMVSLMIRSPPKHFCGGSLISKRWVITAAHCVKNKKAQSIKVRLGDLDLNNRVRDGASPIEVLIDKIESHPRYTSNPTTNDIALLHLKTPVDFTEFIRPICLFSGQQFKGSKYYEGEESYIIGWGRLSSGGPTSSSLKESTVDIVPLELCAEQYSTKKEDFKIDRRVICAAKPGKDTCQGDSGGPLMILNEDDRSFYLLGIVSGGQGCAEPNFAGIYTNVAHFINWINDIIGEDF